MTNPAYTALVKLSTTTTLLGSVSQLLEWDQETYMPKEAIHFRSDQIELLASLAHKQKTSKKFADTLNKLIDLESGEIKDDKLTPAQIAALHQWRRDYLKAVKLPGSFVKKLAKTTSQAMHAWSIAKKHDSFKEFAPHLEKIVSLCRKKADYLGYQAHPYDALIDLHEPEMTTDVLVPLFAKLKLALTTLLKEIATQPQPKSSFLKGTFSPSHQMHVSHHLLRAMGFEEGSSRLDQTVHPFCMGLHPRDTRMTTRIHPDNLLSNIFSVIHEGGHGLYNWGHPEEHFGTPLCESTSLGIEESQSRFWETIIGHSLPFWQHFLPMLQKEFPEQLANVPLEDFYHAINTVKSSLIRVEADEVTYNLHIIVRFEIEKALIEGSLKVKEVPEAWNSKMEEYLGILPQYNADGCLQDIHWSLGAFGYFPTYTLGNLYAAQFYGAFEKAFPDWKIRVAKGDLSFIREWLRSNIHQYGRQFSAQELAQRITGKPLTEEPFVTYINHKYKTIYNLITNEKIA